MEVDGKRIHPSLGSPGDAVVYVAQRLFDKDEKDHLDGEQNDDDDIQIKVYVPPADIPNIFAHRQWRAGMLLADALYAHLLDVKGKIVLELGAGTGLPSIAAARFGKAAFTVCTDYDAPSLIAALNANVQRNVKTTAIASISKTIKVMGHTWGHATDDVQDALPSRLQTDKFDVILLADCIWDALSHDSLVRSLVALLARTSNARIVMASGLHTGREKIIAFLRRAHRAGLVLCPTFSTALNASGITEKEKDGIHWPALDMHEDCIRRVQLESYAQDEVLLHAADLIMEMEIANRTSDEEQTQQIASMEIQQQENVWRSDKPRLTGRRRAFVVEERNEERKEVQGVHERNRWITFLSLSWSSV